MVEHGDSNAEVPGSSPGALMEIAWRDFLVWAFGNPEMRKEFEADTGRSLKAPTSPLDTMIDKACGVKDANMRAFIEWATVKHWGLDEAPEEYRKSLTK